MNATVHILILACLAAGAACPLAAGPATFDTTVTIKLQEASGQPRPINPDIYGQYLEHVQLEDECIYPSIWDNTSPHADSMGLRRDVIDAVRELNVPIVRWPGGCFADVYHWEDAIGPRSKRSPKSNEHWGGMESNQFGTDEFLHWCEAAGVKPYVNVNLGSGSLDEALRWLEYCNGAPDTPQGKRRAANGRVKPWGVIYWGIGNETWGDWEKGHMDARSYGPILARWARAMRAADPSIRILAVGSEEGNDGEWDRTVLSHAADAIDYLTFHTYGISTTSAGTGEFESIAFTPVYMEDRMRKMLAVIDESTATRSRTSPIRISVDEWNIRHHRDNKFTRRDPRNLQDAVFVSGMLNTMIRLSPRVSMGNYVFLVNGNATLRVNANGVVKTPLYHTFQQYHRWMTGSALQVDTRGRHRIPPPPLTSHPGKKVPADYEPRQAPYVDAAAALRSDDTIALSLVNRDAESTAAVTVDLPDNYSITRSWILHHQDLHAANDFQNPDKVKPRESPVDQPDSSWTCPPHSVSLLLCSKEN